MYIYIQATLDLKRLKIEIDIPMPHEWADSYVKSLNGGKVKKSDKFVLKRVTMEVPYCVPKNSYANTKGVVLTRPFLGTFGIIQLESSIVGWSVGVVAVVGAVCGVRSDAVLAEAGNLKT